MLEKGQIHSGMRLVVFAVNESQKRRTRPPHHRRGPAEQAGNTKFEFRHGAVAPRLTDRGRPSTTPSDQTNSSTAAAAAQ